MLANLLVYASSPAHSSGIGFKSLSLLSPLLINSPLRRLNPSGLRCPSETPHFRLETFQLSAPLQDFLMNLDSPLHHTDLSRRMDLTLECVLLAARLRTYVFIQAISSSIRGIAFPLPLFLDRSILCLRLGFRVT